MVLRHLATVVLLNCQYFDTKVKKMILHKKIDLNLVKPITRVWGDNLTFLTALQETLPFMCH
jgi:hypothetical protein